jgi:putative MATE family efflux protein
MLQNDMPSDVQTQQAPAAEPAPIPTPPARQQSLFATVRASLRGEEHDFTQGDLQRAVFMLAIPMMLELSLESVFAVVDMFFVGRLGANAIATVGLTESVMFLVYSFSMGISIAATAIVARRIGEKDPEAASDAASQAIVLAVAVAGLFSVMGVIFASDILRLMGASPDVVTEGTPFTRMMFGGDIVVVLIFVINGIFRGAGDAAMAMRSLWVASIINIILCPVLIHFFGLVGAALATVVGRGAGVAYQLYGMQSGRGVVRFSFRRFRVDMEVLRSIVTVAVPAAFQNIVQSGSWIVLVRLVAETGGTAASAGYQIAIRNVMFFMLPAWGLSNAAATLVGQNLGAGKPERAEESVMLTAKYNVVFMLAVTIIFTLAAAPIVGVFTRDAAVLEYGTLALRILGSGYVFYGISMVMLQALNGAGDTKTPTLINLVCFWVFQIPFAYVLAKTMQWNATGVFIAVPVTEALVAVVAWYFFRKGAWKMVKV